MLQLGRARCAKGEWALASRLYQEASAGFSWSAVEGAGMQIQFERGIAALERTQTEEARGLLEEVRRWAMMSGDYILQGIICHERAKATGAAELYHLAEARLHQARWAFGELENRFEEAECILELGMTLWARGGVEEARQCWREAAELFGQVGAAGGRARSEELIATPAA